MSELAKRLRENADGFFKDLPGMEQFAADLLAAAEIVERAEKNWIWTCSGCGIEINLKPHLTFTHQCPAPPEVKP